MYVSPFKIGLPPTPLPAPSRGSEGSSFVLPPMPATLSGVEDDEHLVPQLGDLEGYRDIASENEDYITARGGECEGLRRMNEKLEQVGWIAKFEKPKTAPNLATTP